MPDAVGKYVLDFFAVFIKPYGHSVVFIEGFLKTDRRFNFVLDEGIEVLQKSFFVLNKEVFILFFEDGCNVYRSVLDVFLMLTGSRPSVPVARASQKS